MRRETPQPERTPLQRLLAPRCVALIGAGVWTDAVAQGAAKLGYDGATWRVHPTRPNTDRVQYFRSVDELPGSPDCAFVAVRNDEVPAVVEALRRRGGGGFVCFSSGFAETGTPTGEALTRQLLASAGSMPFLGPNCYGMVNYFDRVALLPDQVVGSPRERGVAVICQSGTIALTLAFNRRAVPIGYLLTIGNQTRLAAEDLIEALCEDDRVSAFGLYLEGIEDCEKFAHAAELARRAGKPIALVKSGRTASAAATARSHTGALTGSDAVFDAFCGQAGIARCETLSTLCETLKIFHTGGPLPGRRICVLGPSGGDMAMTADLSRHLNLEFPAFSPGAAGRLRTMLSDRVRISNPFDIHTYLWFEHDALEALFREVFSEDFDAVAFTLDCPPVPEADDSAFTPVIDRFIAAGRAQRARAAMLASLPETLSERSKEACLAAGVVPLLGQREALEALSLAAACGDSARSGAFPQLRRPRVAPAAGRSLSEYDGKLALAQAGVAIPRAELTDAATAAAAAARIGFPVVMKVSSPLFEHKSERGGVILNIRTSAQATAAAEGLAMLADQILVEEMLTDSVAEILVGVSVDPQFGQVLMIGAGGVLTELLADTQLLLPPFDTDAIAAAINRLSCARLLQGFRGKPPGDVPALIDTIATVGRYAADNVDRLIELDVNPVMVRPVGRGAVAVDVLVRLA